MSDERFKDVIIRRTRPWRAKWQSNRCPGCPQSLEALFDLINKGNMGTGAFNFARVQFQYLTDDEIWRAYEMWCDGKFDKSVIDKKEQWEKTKTP